MIKKISLAVLFLSFPFYVFSHPHVKITSSIEFEYNGRECTGCTIEWMFDRYFSASIIGGFDKNKDGKFDEKEIKTIEAKAFSNLKNYGYFVFLRKGAERKNPLKVNSFRARIKNGILFYSFFIPFEKGKYDDDFYVAVFDRSFYCATEYAKDAVKIIQKSGSSPKFKISANKKYPVYYNPAGASDDMTIYKKWKPGLETAYPEEVHIKFE